MPASLQRTHREGRTIVGVDRASTRSPTSSRRSQLTNHPRHDSKGFIVLRSAISPARCPSGRTVPDRRGDDRTRAISASHCCWCQPHTAHRYDHRKQYHAGPFHASVKARQLGAHRSYSSIRCCPFALSSIRHRPRVKRHRRRRPFRVRRLALFVKRPSESARRFVLVHTDDPVANHVQIPGRVHGQPTRATHFIATCGLGFGSSLTCDW